MRREQAGLFGALPATVPKPDRIVLVEPAEVTPDDRQLEFSGLAVYRYATDERSAVVHGEFPRLFNRSGPVGRALRDGVRLSGVPLYTGPGQYSFRQRHEDGRWRLVTVKHDHGHAIVKSVTTWSIYLPKHKEAAA